MAHVRFHRRLIGPTAGTNGGNLKLRDCYNHFLASEQWRPSIYFSPQTIWNEHQGNYWRDLRAHSLKQWTINEGDLLFFSGGDWRVLSKRQRRQPPVPVINIVQPRHTRADDPRNEFLSHPAIRIAKSSTGADILNNYGVNGPLFVIPDTIDLDSLPLLPPEKDIDLLIIGLKQPEIGRALFEKIQKAQTTNPQIRGKKIHLQLPPKLPTRQEFLRLLARAKTVCCLPLKADRGAEGFYLPALEAMALDTLVVCPPAVGNSDHCLDGINCIMPEYDLNAIYDAVVKVVNWTEENRENLISGGRETTLKHDIQQERKSILDLADRAYELWAQEDLFVPSSRFPDGARWRQKLSRFFR
ncbi:MAG: glycosyltransferase [Bacteroidota bacterium]